VTTKRQEKHSKSFEQNIISKRKRYQIELTKAPKGKKKKFN
jgi:hypothetical protein